MLLAWVLACGDGGEATRPPLVQTLDTGTPWPEDTGTGTDADADGWSVQEGDCDDADPLVNPGWDEQPADGRDNDCDGRVDEAFSGVVVSLLGDGVASATAIVGVDALGREAWRVELDDPEVQPWFLAELPAGGWVASDIARGVLVEVAPDGTTAELADLSGEPLGLWGVTSDLDGTVLAVTGDRLWRLDPADGRLEELASWDGEQDLYGFDVAVDVLTGEVGVFGYFGGFGTYRDGAFTVHRAYGGVTDEMAVWSGAHLDLEGWRAGGWDADGWGLFAWDDAAAGWTREAGWTEEQWTPYFLAMDGCSGDAYITAQAGNYPYVWRLVAGGDQLSAFWPTLGEITEGALLLDVLVQY